MSDAGPGHPLLPARSRPAIGGEPCSCPAMGVGALQQPLTHRLEGVSLMGVLVEEEVVAGGFSGYP